jgi:pyruvate/2-oxoglutarate dehydrogenase complex dihydrolipoamide acyltransferase (E2) component
VSPENTGSNDRTSVDGGVEKIFEQEHSQDSQPRLNPDLDLDVPVLQVEEINLELEDLQLQVSLQAQLAGFVNISAGVNAHVGKAKLAIKGIEAQARLMVRLEGTLETLRRALDTIDRNPQVLGGAPSGGERVGEGDQRTGEPADSSPHAQGDASGQNTAEGAEARGAEDTAEVEATTAARRKAEELGVDLSRVEGTGAGGRVLVGDVQKAAR